MAGIEKADRLRAWHVRDDLNVGSADRVGARRLYTFGDVACLRVVNDLTNCGLGISIVKNIADQILVELQDTALLEATSLYRTRPVLIVRLEVEMQTVTSEIVWGNSGEGGVAALRQAAGAGLVVVYDLGDSVIRTQRAFAALEGQHV